MEFFLSLYQTFLHQPAYNLVVGLYATVAGHSLGITVILIALIVPFIFLPSTLKNMAREGEIEKLVPKVEEIEKSEREPSIKRRKILDLLESQGINFRYEIYIIAAQLIFVAVLYQIFQNELVPLKQNLLYSFVPNPGSVNPYFLGRFNLTRPDLTLNLVAVAILFFSLYLEYRRRKYFTSFTEANLMFLMPVATFLILSKMPSSKAILLLMTVLYLLYIRGLINLFRAVKPSR